MATIYTQSVGISESNMGSSPANNSERKLVYSQSTSLPILTCMFRLKNLGTATGTLNCLVYASDDSLIATSDSIAASGISTGGTGEDITFTFASGTSLDANSYIILKLTGGGDGTNRTAILQLAETTVTNWSQYYSNAGWSSTTNAYRGQINTGSIASGGTRDPPPPLVVHF